MFGEPVLITPRLGQGFLTGKIDASMFFATSDVRSWFPYFTADARKANQADRRSAQQSRGPKECDACPDRARMAAGAKAMDRADPQHAKDGASGRDPGRSCNRTHSLSARSMRPPQRLSCKGPEEPGTRSTFEAVMTAILNIGSRIGYPDK